MQIDQDVTVNDLLTQYVNGNIKDVIDALESDHPGLTAMFLVVGIGEKRLTRSDCNTISNLLMDRRVETVQLANDLRN